MVPTFCQKWFKKLCCLSKGSFLISDHNDLFQILPVCGSNTYQIIYRKTLDFQCSAFATVARKRFNEKFTAKSDFPIAFYVTITDADII